MSSLDLTPLRRAVQKLREGLDEARTAPDHTLLRDGTIQRFEFTYELAWKMLKRHLERNAPEGASVDALTFASLIRAGSEQGLLPSGWDTWRRFRDARGTTSHTYDEEKAAEVFAVVPDFLAEVEQLLERLEVAGAADS
jgi:nucleotidyltransferase substrate binding protein (TIGR01987 family)